MRFRSDLAVVFTLVVWILFLSCPNPFQSLHGTLGAAKSKTVGVAITSSVAFPLKPSTNNRYLVDQNNIPFLIVGDSPQALIVNLSESDADFYLADRQAAGLNSVWINLLCNTTTGGRSDGSTYDGIIPFTTPGDLSTPNETYFSRVDDMLRLAANHGLTVFLDPIETAGWLSVLESNGVTKARAYGQYLGARYRNVDNIVWMSGNDFQTWTNPGNDAVVQAVALGIKDNDTRHIHTVELNYQVSASLDDSTWAPIIGLDAAYTYFPTYAEVLKEYNRSNFMPVFLAEANYEFESNALDVTSPNTLRRQEYWTMLSGATGQLYGNHYTWQFLSNWKSFLDTTGSTQLGYMKSLFASRPWYNLVPDQNHTAVTAGYGTFSSTGALGANDYLTAARSADGSLLIAYLPSSRSVTVNMTSISGTQAKAWWYNPLNGQATLIGTYSTTGSQAFSPSSGDWVLVIDNASLNLSAPGTSEGPQVLTTVSVTPSNASIASNAQQQFLALALDQYGSPVSPQPSFSWTVSSGGTISSSGLFMAGNSAGGPFTVTASANGLSGYSNCFGDRRRLGHYGRDQYTVLRRLRECQPFARSTDSAGASSHNSEPEFLRCYGKRQAAAWYL